MRGSEPLGGFSAERFPRPHNRSSVQVIANRGVNIGRRREEFRELMYDMTARELSRDSIWVRSVQDVGALRSILQFCVYERVCIRLLGDACHNR